MSNKKKKISLLDQPVSIEYNDLYFQTLYKQAFQQIESHQQKVQKNVVNRNRNSKQNEQKQQYNPFPIITKTINSADTTAQAKQLFQLSAETLKTAANFNKFKRHSSVGFFSSKQSDKRSSMNQGLLFQRKKTISVLKFKQQFQSQSHSQVPNKTLYSYKINLPINRDHYSSQAKKLRSKIRVNSEAINAVPIHFSEREKKHRKKSNKLRLDLKPKGKVNADPYDIVKANFVETSNWNTVDPNHLRNHHHQSHLENQVKIKIKGKKPAVAMQDLLDQNQFISFVEKNK